jgi:hypothetical protein
MNYFIKIDDEPHGPLSAEHIRLRMAERHYKPTDLVRREGSEEWVQLESLKEFRGASAIAPIENPWAGPCFAFAVASLFSLVAFVLGAVFVSEYWMGPIARGIREKLSPFMIALFFATGLGAIVCGHRSLSLIRRSFVQVKGHQETKSGLMLGYGLVVLIPIVAAYAYPAFTRISERGNITSTISFAKQVITYLRLYASDHDGKFPDSAVPLARTSNDAFRVMFIKGQADNEIIFGSHDGPFHPDGNIGHPPDYLEAVKAGENHWALTKGITDSMQNAPLIFENPSEATWPPKWNASLAGQAKPGRTWRNGLIVVGTTDSSVQLLPCENATGTSVGLKPQPDGRTLFSIPDREFEVLNVAQ